MMKLTIGINNVRINQGDSLAILNITIIFQRGINDSQPSLPALEKIFHEQMIPNTTTSK